MKRRWWWSLPALVLVNLAFWVGRWTAPRPTVSVAWSQTPGWVEVRHRGLVVSEWRAEDGEVFEALSAVLQDAETRDRDGR